MRTLIPILLLTCGPIFCDGVSHGSFSAIGTVCPRQKSTLSSIVSGRVEEVFVDVGDVVTKGQTICKLDTTFFDIAVAESAVALESARIEYADAERNFERMKKLFEKPEGESPSISQKRYEDTKLRFDLGRIAVEKAEENFKRATSNLNEATIKAPYDGVITRRYVHPGESVTLQPTTKIVEILSRHAPYIEFAIPQAYRSSVEIGSTVSLEVEGLSKEKTTGVIELIYPDVDERTRSIKCRSDVENTAFLQPGALVRVVIYLKEGGVK